MLLSNNKSSLEAANGRSPINNTELLSRSSNSPSGGHRRRALPVPDSSSTLLPTSFSPQGKSVRFSTQPKAGGNPCSDFFLGGAFYPGKDKKRRQLKRKTLWYRLFCSSSWRRVLSLLVGLCLLFVTVVKPSASFVLRYGSNLVSSSRRRKGLHGTWLLYDESLLSSIRSVEEERADALRLSDQQKQLQKETERRQKALERIVPGWYHRNDDNADKNKVVEEKLKEAERVIDEREGKEAQHEEHSHDKQQSKMDEDRHRSDQNKHTDTSEKSRKAKQGDTEKAKEENAKDEQRRLVKSSSASEDEFATRTIHNMHLFRNRSSCPAALPSEDVRITLVIQSTPERLWILQGTCQRWTDPIILVVFFNTEEAMASADEATKPIGDCPQLQVILHLMDSRLAENDKDNYPVNRLRNIGLDAVQSSHILMVDVDFVPSEGLAQRIRSALTGRNSWRSLNSNSTLNLPLENKDAIVVPAFEKISPSELCSGSDCKTESKEDLMALSIPGSFDELRSCVTEHKECRVFQSNNNIDGHSSTRSQAWLDGKWYNEAPLETTDGQVKSPHDSAQHAARIRMLQCFDSVRYEPYVVLRWCPASTVDQPAGEPTAPYYDERFHGYGKNKISMISTLRIMGYVFSVLPEGFIIHAPHSISSAKQAWEATKESALHRNMDELYPKFLRELVAINKHTKHKIVKQCS